MTNSTQVVNFDSPMGKPLPAYEDTIKATSGNPNDMLFLNITQNEVVYQHYIIIHGQVLEAKGKDDKIVVHHPKLPSLEYPAIDGYFKAVVELASGINELTFEYKQGATVISQSMLTINRGTFTDKPPLKLAILLAKDSPETFDAPPEAQGPGLNDLEAAVNKMRCCAYLWQAYMAEMMYRNGCGRRTFRLEEEPVANLNGDYGMQQTRAKVHIIRSQTSLSEMRDKRNAQQWRPSEEEKKGHDPGFLKRNLRENIAQCEGLAYEDNIACLLMDSHWDMEQDVIVGHTALSSFQKSNSTCVFGSHTTHAWPSNASEIAKCFLDTTKTDKRYLGNDCGQCNEYWQSAALGQGAFLHMVSVTMHATSWAFESKTRGYVNYNRAFMVKEPNNDNAIRMSNELVAWRRLEYIRFTFNHLLALPDDAHFMAYRNSRPGFRIEKNDGGVVIKNASGITAIEICCGQRSYIEYSADNYSKRVSGEIPANEDEKSAIYPTKVFLSFERIDNISSDNGNMKCTRLIASSCAGNIVPVAEVLNI